MTRMDKIREKKVREDGRLCMWRESLIRNMKNGGYVRKKNCETT